MRSTSREFARIGIFAQLALAVWLPVGLAAMFFIDGAVHAQDSIFGDKKIVPFVPSPQDVVDKMIELAGVKKGDTVYDLGSGDGRIVIAAAKKGAKAVGFEIDPDLVKESRTISEKPASKSWRKFATKIFSLWISPPPRW